MAESTAYEAFDKLRANVDVFRNLIEQARGNIDTAWRDGDQIGLMGLLNNTVRELNRLQDLCRQAMSEAANLGI